jgi:hypothetical protein
MTLRAKRRNSCLLRGLRGPRLFLRVGVLAFLNPTQDPDGRHCPWCPRARQAAAGERGTVDTELNQIASREPGDPWPGRDV